MVHPAVPSWLQAAGACLVSALLWLIGLSVRLVALLCILEFIWSHRGILITKAVTAHTLRFAQERVMPHVLEALSHTLSLRDVQPLFHPDFAAVGNHTSLLADDSRAESFLSLGSLESGMAAVNFAMLVLGWLRHASPRR